LGAVVFLDHPVGQAGHVIPGLREAGRDLVEGIPVVLGAVALLDALLDAGQAALEVARQAVDARVPPRQRRAAERLEQAVHIGARTVEDRLHPPAGLGALLLLASRNLLASRAQRVDRAAARLGQGLLGRF